MIGFPFFVNVGGFINEQKIYLNGTLDATFAMINGKSLRRILNLSRERFHGYEELELPRSSISLFLESYSCRFLH